MKLLGTFLFLAAKDFELNQQRKVLSEQQRTFRIVEAASQTPLAECWADVCRVLDQFPHVLNPEDQNCRARSLIFRSLSGFLCNIYVTVQRSHATFPICMFNCLRGDAHARDIYNRKECLWDEFARVFFKEFPKWQDARSGDGLAVLETIAAMADLEPCLWKKASCWGCFFVIMTTALPLHCTPLTPQKFQIFNK